MCSPTSSGRAARAWLEAGGVPHRLDEPVQQCAAGLVQLRGRGQRLAFAAPPLLRSGPVDGADLNRALAGLRLSRTDVGDAQ